ncbi:PREDICTED: uncharacterized protein LOC107330350 [Acropora digitifera]|uniref:uncharacterized protein LOC107330350 n=1 Tax=Acropora digitifera TaxID=70779 RepID=UPI00077A41E8|nr:PREDICTED: uncharacterized protein LOC107330350 [Acropora digitifera]
MKVKDLKWYSPCLFLAGAILSVADPITDILTLVEFYRNDHKTLFGVGLFFIILPCLAFVILVTVKEIGGYFPEEEEGDINILCFARTVACGLHPFTAAFARLQGFVFSFKKWRGADDENDVNGDHILIYIDLFLLFESVLEAAPQFIVQLYAINAQEEPVQIIQMISLLVSFLNLNWAFVITDEMLCFEEWEFTLRRKIFIFLAEFLLLSSRIFAVCYFTVTFKWWVIGVLLFHTFVIVIAKTFLCCYETIWDTLPVPLVIISLGLHWLKDDAFVCTKSRLQGVLLSNVLFVIENVVMILVFYFSQHSNSWFSLPVTVCVCSFSVLGSTMKIAGWYVFSEQERSQYVVDPKSNSNKHSALAEMM